MMTLNMTNLKELLQIIRSHFVKSTIFFNAAALSYYTILSLLPLILIVFSLLATFNVFAKGDTLQANIKSYLLATLSAGSQPKVVNIISSFIDQIDVGKIGLLGITILVFTLLGLLTNIEKGLNEIWNVPKSRSPIKRFLIFWTVTTLGSFLLMLSFAFGMKVKSHALTKEMLTFGQEFIQVFSIYILPILLVFALFTLIYKFIPNATVNWKAAFLGGFIGSLLFELIKIGYTSYVSHSIMNSMLYGSLAAIPIFFLWIYLIWAIVLLGAVICFMVDNYKELRIAHRAGNLPLGWITYLPVSCMFLVCQNFTNGNKDHALNIEDMVKEIHLPYDILQNAIQLLVERNWIKKINNPDLSKGYIPATPPDAILLNDFFNDVFFFKVEDKEILKAYVEEGVMSDFIVQLKQYQYHNFGEETFSSLMDGGFQSARLLKDPT